MEQEQFIDEYRYTICMTILNAMRDRSIVTPEEYESARCELLKRYDAPEGALHSEFNKLS